MANFNLPQAETEKLRVCRMLRTKTAFNTYDEEDLDPWQAGTSTTAVFWCLGTMATAGPDDMYCHPSTCREGRACFRPGVE